MRLQDAFGLRRVHYRIGSLESYSANQEHSANVHYRIGSLENLGGRVFSVLCVHYRIGSLEI